MQDEYSAYRDEGGVSSNLLITMRQLSDRLQEQEAIVADLKAQLEIEETILNKIKSVEIPTALDGLHGNFDLQDGRSLEVKKKIRASIAGEKAPPAIAWLDANGYGAIVKRELIFRFGKGDKNFEAFEKLIEEFEKSSTRKLAREKKFNVHPQTLEAFIREKMTDGVQLPRELLGIFEQNIAKVSGEKAGDIPF